MRVKDYQLSMDVDYERLTYSGKVAMSLEGASADLTLNSIDLQILKASSGGKEVRWEKGAEEEEIVFHGISPGVTTLEISFEGKVAEKLMAGFYKSRFNGGHILTTQFESTQARRMFPCIDHPAYKAVFNVELTIRQDLGVVFNTPVELETDMGDGRKRIKFQPTPRMSTYLLYVGIGHFTEVTRDHGELKVIVALPEQKRRMATFALDHAGPTVAYFERYFGIPYPLPKLHLVSVPDTWVGAMENWGAISFREIALLVDEGSSAILKRQVALVIAHEIAHQWFGNLVTMAWWNDLWLNESFATFMGYKVVEELHPEWKVWNDFLADSTSRAFLWDSLLTTHPIEAKVVRPVDIDEAFDEISYEKGGAVLRMMEAYIGKEGFRKGVSAYLRKYEYGNAESQNLWKAIEGATGVPVPRVLGQWIQRKGYPIVTASLKDGKLHLEQQRFLIHGEDTADPWPLPILLRIDGRLTRVLMEGPTQTIDLLQPNPRIVVNAGRAGYFRVKYEGLLGERMAKEIHTIPETERWGYVQDNYALLLAGKATVGDYLAMVRSLSHDDSSLVSSEIFAELSNLVAFAEGIEPAVAEIRAFASTQLERIGLHSSPKEADSVKTLRERLALLRVFVDRAFATEMATQYRDYGALEPEVKSAVAVAVALTGGAGEFAELSKAFLSAETETEAWRMSLALASFPQKELFEESLRLVFKPETGLGRALTLFSNVLSLGCRTAMGRDALWSWMEANIDMLIDVTKGSAIFSQFVQLYVSKGGIDRADEMRVFMASKPLPGGESGKAKGLELLKVYERLYREFCKA